MIFMIQYQLEDLPHMNVSKKNMKKRLIALLLTVLMAVGCLPYVYAMAEVDPLRPDDLLYLDGQPVNSNADITLHKQAKRVGADEWEVTVSALLTNKEIHKQNAEVVVLLDLSGSMNWCTDPAHLASSDGDGNHVHSSACIAKSGCQKEPHEHTVADCYEPCTKTGNHGNGHGCTRINGDRYLLTCTKPAHTHTRSCCGHMTQSQYRSTNQCFYYDENGNKVYLEKRLTYAHEAIERLASNLPEGTDIKYTWFKSSSAGTSASLAALKSVSTGTYTPLTAGTKNAINQFDSNSSSKKFLVVVTDGFSTDEYPTNQPYFTNFKNNGGTVFTIGFTVYAEELVEMASDEDKFMFAEDNLDLTTAIDSITNTISAMIDDPMGENVDFIHGSLTPGDNMTNVGGSSDDEGFTADKDGIVWNPETDPISAGEYSYSYRVKLSEDAQQSAGVYSGEELNKTTTLNYSVTSSDGKTTAYTVKFPIPEATYQVATLQVKWVDANGNELPGYAATAVEPVITDYQSDDYTPAFKTNYKNAPASVAKNSNSNYFYQNTVITKGGQKVYEGNILEDDFDLTDLDPKEYVVTHQYKEIQKYAVIYEYEAGTPENTPDVLPTLPVEGPKTVGETVNVKDIEAVAGYRFSGWRPKNDEVTIADGEFTMPAQNVVLVGSWEKLPAYRVSYEYIDPVPADAPGVPTDDKEYYEGDTVIVAENPTLENYTFSGWTVVDNDATIGADGNLTMPAKNIVLQGQWTENEKYTVTYKYIDPVPNGAPVAPTDTNQYYEGDTVTVAGNPSLKNYTFSGWTVANDAATIGTDGKLTMPAQNIVLQGQWTENEKYTVTYKYIDPVPTGAPSVPTDTNQYYEGDTVTVAGNPSLKNYTFSGWTVADSAATIGTDGRLTMPAKNIVLQGQWTENEKYTVKYEYIGTVPTGAPSVPTDTNQYYEGDTVTVAGNPSLKNYTFSGWTVADNAATIGADGKLTMPAQNIVLQGQWTENEKYTVTYEYIGTVPDGAPGEPTDDKQYYEDDSVTVAGNPSLKNYTFSGWTVADNAATIGADGKLTMPAQNIVLQGEWTENEKYTV
ncbi:MAG: VWA domain-containing protein, partial [Clostridiales bacterium]|nr:VWA domain-containing protein [Clostridiales bacterium]